MEALIYFEVVVEVPKVQLEIAKELRDYENGVAVEAEKVQDSEELYDEKSDVEKAGKVQDSEELYDDEKSDVEEAEKVQDEMLSDPLEVAVQSID